MKFFAPSTQTTPQARGEVLRHKPGRARMPSFRLRTARTQRKKQSHFTLLPGVHHTALRLREDLFVFPFRVVDALLEYLVEP